MNEKKQFRPYFALSLLLLTCCVALPPQKEKLPEQTFPYALEIIFTSQIDNPYVILSGPGESYRRVPFNSWCLGKLQSFQKNNFNASDSPSVTMAIDLIELSTRYDEFGVNPFRAGSSPLSKFGDDTDGFDVPGEIHKGATLTAEVKLSAGSKTFLATRLNPSFEVTIPKENSDAWSYDYGPVLHGLIRELIEELTLTLPQRI